MLRARSLCAPCTETELSKTAISPHQRSVASGTSSQSCRHCGHMMPDPCSSQTLLKECQDWAARSSLSVNSLSTKVNNQSAPQGCGMCLQVQWMFTMSRQHNHTAPLQWLMACFYGTVSAGGAVQKSSQLPVNFYCA